MSQPEFETDEDRNYFIVTIRQHEGFGQIRSTVEIVDEPINEPISRQEKNLMSVKANKAITVKTLAEMMGVSQATVKREIVALKSKGRIKRVGSKKSGHWEIITEM